MNKVDTLNEKLKKITEKTRDRIKKIQKKCKHENTERWSDYEGIHEQCKDCNFYLR